MEQSQEPLSIVVVGASGDLARKKIFPALFSLYCQGYLPDEFRVFGFARSEFTDAAFRERVTEHLTCRYAPGESCADRMTEFLERCYYVAGSYDAADAFLNLYEVMRGVEGQRAVNRMFYLAIPPSIFLDVAQAIGSAGLVACGEGGPWSRVVIEKPFGRDRESSDTLTRELGLVFTEEQTYRIDHYLGKEVIQNLMVLRFANLVFEPIWNRDFIREVRVDWREDIGVVGRAGYFDQYGIVRDVVQNHLLQVVALVAMEPPPDADARTVRDEKVKVLRHIPPLTMADVTLGQFTEGTLNGRMYPGYRDEDTIPDDSITPTYASVRLRIENDRWRGVPFVVTAGKGLASRYSEVRIVFRDCEQSPFCAASGCVPANELVIRIQPDEAIYLRIVNKEPGLDMSLVSSDLNLRYQATFAGEIPDAYECLLLDVMSGDKSLFIRSDELAAAWDVFTPVLHEIARTGVVPVPYPFGSEALP